MADAPAWQVDDYRGPQGARPVREFLDGLSKGARPKVYAALTMLEERGNRLALPRSRALGDGLYELRIAHPEGRSGSSTAFCQGAESSCCTGL